jgi:hypothetical protein
VSCGNRINRHLRNRRDGPDSGVISSIFMRMPYRVSSLFAALPGADSQLDSGVIDLGQMQC